MRSSRKRFAQYLETQDAQSAETWELAVLAPVARELNVSVRTYARLRAAILDDVAGDTQINLRVGAEAIENDRQAG